MEDTRDHAPASAYDSLSTSGRLLQYVGQEADERLTQLWNMFKSPPCAPHLKELAKLANCPKHEKLNWAEANAEDDKLKKCV